MEGSIHIDPLVESAFKTGTEGWNIFTYPGGQEGRSPEWVKTDQGGAVKYTPEQQDSGWYFSGPAAFTGNRPTLYGGKIIFNITLEPKQQGGGQAVLKADSANLVLIGKDSTALGFDTSNAVTGKSTQGSSYEITVPLKAAKGWIVLSTGQEATEDELKAVLGNLLSLFIRGDCAVQPVAYAMLNYIAVYENPSHVIKPSLDIYYQDSKLYASWNAVELAYAYRLEVKDKSGKLVYNADIAAEVFVPPIVLESDTFKPEEGKSYSVDVYVTGPYSDIRDVTIVSLGNAVLQVLNARGGVKFEWNDVQNAAGYDLKIIDKDDSKLAYHKENIASHPFFLGYDSGLQPDVEYIASLRARNGQSFGGWSQPTDFILPSAAKVLEELKQRLIDKRPDNKTLVFNSETLPEGVAGNPDEILQLIKTNFKTDKLIVGVAADPVVDAEDKTLTVMGNINLNGKDSVANAVFTVSEDITLLMTLKLVLSSEWIFSDSFTSLKNSVFDFLYISDNLLYLTSNEHNEDGVFFKLQPGMNLQGKLKISSSLVPVTEQTADLQTITYGGHIDYTSDKPEFVLSGQSQLDNLSVNTLGITPMTMKNGIILLRSKRNGEGQPSNQCIIRGTVSFASTDIVFDLDVPNKVQDTLVMQQAQERLALSSIGAAVEAMGGSELVQALPAALSNISSMSMTGFEFRFDPEGDKPTYSSVSINALNTDFNLIPGKIAINELIFNLSVNYYPYLIGEVQKTFTGLVKGTFNLVDNFPVSASIAVPEGGNWLILVEAKTQKPTLDMLAGFLGETAQNMISAMPQYIRELTSFSIKNVSVCVDPTSPSLKYLTFCIEQTGTWNIIPGILEVYGWTIDTKVENSNSGWNTKALLSGKIKLGNSDGAPEINVLLPVPAGSDGWKLALSDKGVHIPTLDNIFYTVGLEVLNTVLPKGIKDLGNIDVSALEFVFDPGGSPAIKSIFLSMNTSAPWVIIPDKKLSIEKLETSFSFKNAAASAVQDQSYVIGYIKGCVTVFNNKIFLAAQKMSKDDSWKFKLAVLNPIHIPGLADLADWMLPTAVSGYIPETFMPFGKGFDLFDLGMEFDISAAKLDMIRFKIVNSDAWNILPGYLSVDDVLVEAKIDKPFQDAQGLTCLIEGIVYICDAGIKISGAKPSPDAKWILSGNLVDSVEIDFEKLFTQMKLGSLPIPYDYGFPRKIIFVEANTQIVPQDKSFHFDFSTQFDWSFSFGPLSLQILSVKALLDIEKEDDKGIRPYLFKASGNFKFCGLDGDLGFSISNQPSVDTVLTAEISGEKAKGLSLSQMADNLTPAQDTDSKWGSLPMPASLKPPVFGDLKLYINMTKEVFIVCGSSPAFGKVGFLAQKIDVPKPAEQGESTTPDATGGEGGQPTEKKWAYLVAAALSDSFKFSNITDELSVIDSILKIKNAGFVISSFQSDSLATVISPVPEMSGVLPVTMPVNPVKIQPGAVFYGELDITGDLFGNIIKLGDGIDHTLKIQLYAIIDKNSVNTEFGGSVNQFTILNTITFSRISFRYFPNKASQFQLDGSMSVKIEQTDYMFDGSLTVNDKAGHFEVATAKSIENPLGMPGIVIEKLQLIVDYNFGSQQPGTTGDKDDTKTQILLGGAVGFGQKDAQGNYPINLEGNFLFKDGSPEVVEIALAKPLSVDQFFATVLPAKLWPEGFIRITFKTGRIYYSKDACKLFDYDYKKGFHLDTVIDIYDFAFNITADVENDGITITGSAVNQIDLGFIQFTDAACTGKGSGVYITAKGSAEEFGLTGGISLFNEKFLSVPKIGYNTGAKEFMGTIAYNGDIEILRASISFAWNKEKGFRITNWPMAWMTQALEYTKLIEDASRAVHSGCGEIVGLVFKEVITTKFHITPKFGKSDLPDSLPLALTIGYEVIIADKSILTANMPDITINIPKPKEISFSGLAQILLNTITNNASKIMEQIFSDNEKLSEFIAAIVITKGSEAIASSLICRGLKNIKGGGGGGGQGPKTGDEWLGEAEGAATAAETAATIPAAAAAAATAEVACDFAVPIFVAAIGLFASLIASFLIWLGIETEEAKKARKQKEEQEEKKKQAEEAKQRAIEAIRKKLAINNLTSVFDRQARQVNVFWNRIDGDSIVIKYSVKVYLNNTDHVIYSADITDNRFTIPYNYPGDNDLYVVVTASFDYVKDGKTYSYNGNAQTQKTSIEILLPPVNLKLEQVCDRISVNWQKGDNITRKYTVEAFDGTTSVYKADNVTSLSQDIPHEKLTVGKTYTVKVNSSTDISSSDTVTADIIYTQLAAPSNLNYKYVNKKAEPYLAIAWNSSDRVAGYAVEVYSDQGSLLTVDISITGTTAIIKGSAVAAGKTYLLRVGAQTEDRKQTVWSDRITAGTIGLDVPKEITLSYSEVQLTASWSEVTGAESYRVQLLDSKGVPVVPQPTVNYDRNRAVIDGRTFKDNDTYTVGVMSVSAHAESDWAVAQPIMIINLPVPENLVLHYADNVMTVTWNKVDKADSSLKIIDEGTGAVLKIFDGITNTTVTVGAPDVVLTPGVSYTAELRAVKEKCSSGVAKKTLNLLQIPEMTSLYYQDGKVYGVWKQVQGAPSYGFRLLKESGEPVGGIVEGITDITASVGGNGITFAEGEKYNAQVRSEGPDQIGNWSVKQLITVVILDAPQNIAVSKTPDSKMPITWDAVQKAESYTFQLLNADDKPAGAAVQGLNQANYTLDPTDIIYVKNAVYSVVVRGETLQSRGPWVKSGQIVQLDKVKVSIAYNNSKIEARWDAVTNATGYVLQVIDNEGKVAIETRIEGSGTTSAVADLSNKPDGNYSTRIKAVGGNNTIDGPWSDGSVIHLVKISILAGNWNITKALENTGDLKDNPRTRFTGCCSFDSRTFTGVNPGDTIAVQLIFSDTLYIGGNIPPYVAITVAGSSGAMAQGTGYEAGKEGELNMQATNAGIGGEGDTIKSFWMNFQASAPELADDLKSLSGCFIVPDKLNDIPVKGSQSFSFNSVCWYTVMEGDQREAELPVDTKPPKLDQPVIEKFVYSAETLTVNWGTVKNAKLYDIELMNVDGKQLIKTYSGISTINLTIDCQELKLESKGSYTVHLRATAGRIIGDWSDSKAVNLPDVPDRAVNLANRLKQKSETGLAAAPVIKNAFPSLTATNMAQVLQVFDEAKANALELAKCLKACTYSMNESSPAIKAVFPSIDAAQMADILMEVFND